MNLIIEKAKPEDAAEILAYLCTAGGETDNLTFGAEGLPFTTEEEMTYIRSLENSKHNAMFVARLDGRIVGNASLTVPVRARLRHRGELAISVLQEAWGLGIGSKLMEEVIKFSRETAKAEILHLEVRSDNHRAIHLYEKFGFQKNGVCPGLMKIGGQRIDCDLMDLYL